MPDPMTIARHAAIPAAMLALVLGAALHGLEMGCGGGLDELRGSAGDKGLLIPVILDFLSRPAPALGLFLPFFGGFMALMLAGAFLRKWPRFAVGFEVAAILTVVLVLVIPAPRYCALSLSGQALALRFFAVAVLVLGAVWIGARKVR